MSNTKALYCRLIIVAIVLLSYDGQVRAATGVKEYCGKAVFGGGVIRNPRNFYKKTSRESQKNLKRLNSLVEQQNLNESDAALLNVVSQNPPFIIRRQPSKYLCDVLNKDGIKAIGVNTPPG